MRLQADHWSSSPPQTALELIPCGASGPAPPTSRPATCCWTRWPARWHGPSRRGRRPRRRQPAARGPGPSRPGPERTASINPPQDRSPTWHDSWTSRGPEAARRPSRRSPRTPATPGPTGSASARSSCTTTPTGRCTACSKGRTKTPSASTTPPSACPAAMYTGEQPDLTAPGCRDHAGGNRRRRRPADRTQRQRPPGQATTWSEHPDMQPRVPSAPKDETRHNGAYLRVARGLPRRLRTGSLTRTRERAGLIGNRPTYLAPDSRAVPRSDLTAVDACIIMHRRAWGERPDLPRIGLPTRVQTVRRVPRPRQSGLRQHRRC